MLLYIKTVSLALENMMQMTNTNCCEKKADII